MTSSSCMVPQTPILIVQTDPYVTPCGYDCHFLRNLQEGKCACLLARLPFFCGFKGNHKGPQPFFWGSSLTKRTPCLRLTPLLLGNLRTEFAKFQLDMFLRNAGPVPNFPSSEPSALRGAPLLLARPKVADQVQASGPKECGDSEPRCRRFAPEIFGDLRTCVGRPVSAESVLSRSKVFSVFSSPGAPGF